MISQAILAEKLARDPPNCPFHANWVVCTGNVSSRWLSGAWGARLHLTAGAETCAALSLTTAAPSRQTPSSNALLSAASLHLHCSPL